MGKKAKTLQQGYYKLPSANKWLHFSMNCWINLKQDCGRDVGLVFADYDEQDTLSQFITLSDIAFAALKAHDQEEGNDIDYDIFKVRTWMESLDEGQAEKFVSAMTHSINPPQVKGKKQAKK